MSSLADIRVLEFAGSIGSYTGKLYADYGADVIHIEPPEGDPLRSQGPFYKDQPGRETSLKYQYHNTGKRSLVVDIRKEEGKEIFLKLIKTASLLIESFPPGYLESLGLGYERLKEENRKLVHVSITPFGQTGPYRDYPACDLTLMALGGFLYLFGVGDRKPSLVYGEQAYMMGMLNAALYAFAALLEAEESGEGQFLDVSLQACVATYLENSVQFWDLEKRIRRGAGDVEAGYGHYRCKDGYLAMLVALGRNAYLWKPLPKLLKDHGIEEGEIFENEEWFIPEYRRQPEQQRIFKEIFEKFSLQYDKLYIYEKAQEYRLAIYPVNDPKDILENPQLRYRKFFKTLPHPVLGGEILYPGAPCTMEKIPWQLKPAPAFGQHTREILEELGYSEEQIKELKEGGVVIA